MLRRLSPEDMQRHVRQAQHIADSLERRRPRFRPGSVPPVRPVTRFVVVEAWEEPQEPEGRERDEP